MKSAHLVCFRIGKETYGVDITAVREIVRPQTITAVPGAPRYLLGITNLRGKIISVVDLADRLGLPSTVVGSTSRILVMNVDGNTLGFMVDAATEVLKLPAEAVELPPEDAKGTRHAAHMEGIGVLEDRLIILLNLSRVLSKQELASTSAAVSTDAEAVRNSQGASN